MNLPPSPNTQLLTSTTATMSDYLDAAFPLGDGVADVTARVTCPYCGEEIELAVDPGGGSLQEYVEDCEVCCRRCSSRCAGTPMASRTPTRLPMTTSPPDFRTLPTEVTR
jgi:ribosomal protein L24E